MNLEPYSATYIEQCFQQWYMLGCPPIKEFAPKVRADERNRVPNVKTLIMWHRDYSWREKRDAIIGRASQVMEDELVTKTVEMWRRQASVATEIGEQAYSYLLENGFDNANSALTALKWSHEEERKTRGAEVLVAKIKDAANGDLLDELRSLLPRALNPDEGETITIEAEQSEEDA